MVGPAIIVNEILQRRPLVFKVSDPLFVVPLSGGMVRPSQLPVGLDNFPNCLSFSQIAFLEPSSSSCVLQVTTPSQCTSSPLLQLQGYLNSTVVASAPALAFLQQNFGSNVDFTLLAPEDTQALFVPIRLATLSSPPADGTTTDTATTAPASVPSNIPTVQLSADGQTCSNVVNTVEYVITHNASIIVGVVVNAVLSTINASNAAVQQQHIVRFVPWLPTNNTNGYEEPLPRSGNPGYLDGYPILVSSGLGFNDVGLPQNLSQVPVRALALPGLDPLGGCSTSATEQVRFGQNIQMSCLQYLDIEDPAAACSSLQALIVNTFESAGATLPTNVSAFGNGTVFTADSSAWLPILRNFVPTAPSVVFFRLEKIM
ncbi:hypothetical protein RvY_19345-2 [Ramazzottius varieornatus]|uniref:Tectonic-1-3 domain-containing protein n=1 Tax=Ramazzottius varieornatus TaxID=947166 RepID=A0A1D1WBV1_RAMVA|nr:hypothetical protein RvY_19345-2 [Ramazzottius varieornatus]